MKNVNQQLSLPSARDWLRVVNPIRAVLGISCLTVGLVACGSSPAAGSPGSTQAYYGDGKDHSWTSPTKLGALALVNGTNPLTALNYTSATNGWGPVETNMSNGETAANDGRPISIRGRVYAQGLGVHAPSTIVYNVAGQCSSFLANFGVDDEAQGRGSVNFQIWVDGILQFDSGTLTGQWGAQWKSISLVGKNQLKLVVTDGGDGNAYDHADWAGPMLYGCNTGTTSPTPPPAVVYGGPIAISKGGTYTGNWQSDDPNTPAVLITTSDPVIIQNSNIRGKGNLIKAWFANLTVRNTNGYGMNPNVVGSSAGRFINAEQFYSLDVENNYLENTAGIYVHTYMGTSTQKSTVKILKNKVKNIDGRRSNGNGGYNGQRDLVQFFQMNDIHNIPNVEIGWNEIVNQPYNSSLEENLNFYQSSGTSGSPISVHDNYIQGAYAINPTTDSSYSGGGILLGDGDVSNLSIAPGYANIYNNQIVGTSNQGIGIAGGHDYNVWNNRIISSGRLPDGSIIAAGNVGIYVWDTLNGASHGTFFNNTVHDNTIGWTRINSNGSTWQNDTWFASCSTACYNNKDIGTAVTTGIESNEYQIWLSKLSSNGIVIGP